MGFTLVGAAISAAVSETVALSLAAGALTFGFSTGAFFGSLALSGLSHLVNSGRETDSGGGGTASQGRAVTVQQPVSPWRIIYGRARVGGVITYKQVTYGDSYYHMVVTLAGHVCESVDEIWLGDEKLVLDEWGFAGGRYSGGYVRVRVSLGDEPGQPFPDLVAESGGRWTDAHRQTGRCKIYLRCVADNDRFPQGIPNITAVVRGRKVYDPRSGLTAWSDNPALCLADYLSHPDWGLRASYAGEIHAADLLASADICDEAVATLSGTEKRYTCNGSFTLNGKPADLIPRLAASMAGYAIKVGAEWHVVAGAYATPAIDLGEKDLAGAISWQSKVSRRDNCNAVRGVFVDPASSYQPTDFPALESDAYLAEDNGDKSWHDLELSWTNSASMAQRIAKIDLLRTRQGLSVTFPGKLSAFRAQPGRTVALTVSRYGWNAKPFFVEGGQFRIDADGTLGYTLTLRETAAAIYDWATDEEQAIDIAPNTDLGDPFGRPGLPGAPVIDEEIYATTGSAGAKSRAVVSWSPSPSSFSIGYDLAWRASGTSVWQSTYVPGATQATLDDIAPGYYDLRVRAVSALGSKSEWSATSVEIRGLTAPPSDPVGLYVVANAGNAYATWSITSDIDVRLGGRAVFRHSPATSGAAWVDGVVLDELPGGAVAATLPLLAGTYMLKFQDSGGNWSSGMASFVASEDWLNGWTVVATATEQPAFGGAKTSVAVVSSALQLDAAALLDGLADSVDAWPSLDTIGGLAATGSYAFASTMDLGTTATRNFIAKIGALSFDTADLVDARTTDVDYWDDVDGAVVNDCDVTAYIRTTPDNPAGTPTWSEWRPWRVGDFNCRAAQFRLDVASGSRNHNIAVSTLEVRARTPV